MFLHNFDNQNIDTVEKISKHVKRIILYLAAKRSELTKRVRRWTSNMTAQQTCFSQWKQLIASSVCIFIP